jgi:septin family protein
MPPLRLPYSELTEFTVIIENGVRLKLNIIDTPGYGDLINNEGCWDPIVKYVS